MFDAHNHYTNWKQASSDYFGLISAMDKAEVEESVIFGLPTNFDENYYAFDTETDRRLLEEYRELPEAVRSRLLPFLCAVNPENESAVSYLENIYAEFSDFIFGIGEILCRHDRMSLNIFGHEITPDNSAMLKIYDFAAEKGLPVLLHSNVSAAGEITAIYREEIERAFVYNPECKFIWAHAGVSKEMRDLKDLIPTLATILERNSNVYVDLSWVVFDYYIEGREEEWAEILSEFSDRFMIGTDHTGKWEKYVETVRRYDKLFSLLSEEVAEKIRFSNAEKLICRR